MSKEAVVQIRMDSKTKESVENVYRSLGTTFSEAVRVFAVQSIAEHGFPFLPKVYKTEVKSARGRLASYASDALREQEPAAFERAMAEKHEQPGLCGLCTAGKSRSSWRRDRHLR